MSETAPPAFLPPRREERQSLSRGETAFQNFIGQAIAKGDGEMVKALLDARKRVHDEDAERAFDEAYTDMWAKLPLVEKDGTVNLAKDGQAKRGYNFAKYEDIIEVIKPILAEHDFSLQFRDISTDASVVKIEAILRHRAGHKVTCTKILPPDHGAGRNSLQALGSADSYARRYATCDLLNIVLKGTDDDGQNAAPARRPMPPVGKTDPIGGGLPRHPTQQRQPIPDSPPPAGSMREAAQSILTAADEQWLNELEMEFAAAHTVTEITEIVGSAKVRNAKKKAPRIVVERIEELEANAMERIDRETAASSPFEEQAPTDGEDQ